ncbi:hypothetical protein GLW08_00330 [Pontibacillus yanchengensis]|uniref:Uncharacterized protein n=1 Tax=Pontibacillus yanchengensis TaxID=462910 RepID=A0ACC7VAC6_9BACI|nr:CBO0543 family protein [Pontibacillus yanchengensis]MYL51776.1 hypothetical protein [Pontibacillus yanchengensis]
MTIPNYEDIRKVHQQLVDMRVEYWFNHDLLSFQWWILILVLILPWFIWWRFVDKKRIDQILLFGTLLILLVSLLDDLGVEMHLWSYPYQLVPLLPKLVPIDYGMLVVAHMYLYQKYTRWKSFIVANIVMAAVFTFIFEPITVWLDIYKMEDWRYIYSFPIYILKAVLIKWLVDMIIIKKKMLDN